MVLKIYKILKDTYRSPQTVTALFLYFLADTPPSSDSAGRCWVILFSVRYDQPCGEYLLFCVGYVMPLHHLLNPLRSGRIEKYLLQGPNQSETPEAVDHMEVPRHFFICNPHPPGCAQTPLNMATVDSSRRHFPCFVPFGAIDPKFGVINGFL